MAYAETNDSQPRKHPAAYRNEIFTKARAAKKLNPLCDANNFRRKEELMAGISGKTD